ncbi:MAG: hypothetical protein E7370_05235 [Clostridiales bacterium]|nr:hypothetical protein [Clostridiales bacterium]
MTNVLFFISVAVFLFTIVFVIWLSKTQNKVKKHLKKMLVFALGLFLAAVLLYFPKYYYEYEGQLLGGLNAFLNTLINVVVVFTLDPGVLDVANSFTNISESLFPFLVTYLVIIHVLCPIFTISVILSLFKNLSSRISYLLRFFKEVYIFSELNDKSVALAKDLKKNNKNRVIVFCGVKDNEGESDMEIIGDVLELSAISYRREIQNIYFKLHSKKRSINFYLISEDYAKNTNQAVLLLKEYGEINNTNLYLFSNNTESELLLSSVANKKMKVRRIDEAQSLINNQLYYNGVKIFNSAKSISNSVKQISAIVVGLGSYGFEMFKTLLWYGQMDGYALKINAFDKDELAKDKVTFKCPEIMSPSYNGVYVPGEAYYEVEVHSGISTDSQSFVDKINQITDATYVIVALGSDSENIKTAVSLRVIFERMGIKPIIQAVVYNSEVANHLEGITNFKNQKYDIELIGNLESLYTEAIFMDSVMEKKALERHLKWGKEEDFWGYEYNYRSSIASAIHFKARIDCNIEGADKAKEDLSDEVVAKIANLEHRRWNAYMRSQGYIYNPIRNDLGKMHLDLKKFGELDGSGINKDINVGTK